MGNSIRHAAAGLAALAIAVTPVVAAAAPASAAPAASCSDRYQVGSTTVLSVDGQSALSIKQYWSPECQENYGYAYVWQSFRDSHPGTWDIVVDEIWVHSPGVYTAPVTNSVVQSRQVELWTPGFKGAGRCTYATALFSYGSAMPTGKTDQRCG